VVWRNHLLLFYLRMAFTFGLLVFWSLLRPASTLKLKSFVGNGIVFYSNSKINNRMTIVMRKQKASDKRTSRLQKGLEFERLSSFAAISTSKGTTPFPIVTSSPMATATWNYKTIDPTNTNKESAGRGRARKRAQLYLSLASYHAEFLNLLTEEYRAEVSSSFSITLERILSTLIPCILCQLILRFTL
jgi:hypothetical protein